MARALDELVVAGVGTTQGFHRRLMADPEFRAGDIDIQFLERRPDLITPRLTEPQVIALAVAAALAEDEARVAAAPRGVRRRPHRQSAVARPRRRLEGLR